MTQHDTLTQALQQIADWNSHTTEYAVDYGSNGVRDFYRNIARAAISATQPAQAAQPVSRDVIRDVFLRNGFTIKDGCSDLKPYVYAAANALLEVAAAQPVQGVPEGWEIREDDTWIYFKRPDGFCQAVTPNDPHTSHAQTLHMLMRAMLAAAPTPPTQPAPVVPEGWKLSVSDSDGRKWLHIESPGGAKAALSTAAAIDGGRHATIAAQVLDALQAALTSSPTPPAQQAAQGEPLADHDLIMALDECARILESSRMLVDNARCEVAAKNARAAMRTLTAQGAGEVMSRTESEIVDQTEQLAAFLMAWRWGQEPEDAGLTFRNSENTKAQGCWQIACQIQDMLTSTDVENAVANVDVAEELPTQPTAGADVLASDEIIDMARVFSNSNEYEHGRVVCMTFNQIGRAHV